MTLLEIGFFSWLCFMWGQCAPGFEQSACQFSWNGETSSVNCLVVSIEELQDMQPDPDPEPTEPVRRRKPRRGRRSGGRG